jgi:hypothetical protein
MLKRIVSGIVLALLIIGMPMFQGIERAFVDEARSGGLAFSSASATQYTPPNIIDHLPFIINETDVYYIVKDLNVSGNGITILADNTVLIGQGYTIAGSGAGNGINISTNNVIITNCNINNFTHGIYIRKGTSSGYIYNNKIYNNYIGIYFEGGTPNPNGYVIKNNVIINNSYGVVNHFSGENNYIYNNYVRNTLNAWDDSGLVNKWNTTYDCSSGSNIIGGSCKGGNYWSDYIGLDDGSGSYPNNISRDGIGDTNIPYSSNDNIANGGDYLPLVDVNPPRYDLTIFDYVPPNVALNITWMDNVQVDNAILEFDGVNYTDSVKIDESLGFSEHYDIWSSPVQHKVTYSKSFTNLSLGTHYYKWFANDTKNHWNSTELLSFTVTNISPSPIQIEVVPCNQVGDMKGSFQIGSIAYFKVTGNCTCQTQNLLLSINVFDNDSTTIGVSSFQGSITHGLSTFIISVSIPTSAKIGNATVYANAYTDWPHNGGVPYCPEVSATFQIIGP